MTETKDILHATTLEVGGTAALIVGPSGSGKSALAVQLLALGATLVADDRTVVQRDGRTITTSAPDAIRGQIEARYVGLLHVRSAGPTPLSLVIDMAQRETQRLPALHSYQVLGLSFPCLHNPDTAYFPSAVLLYMKQTSAKEL